MCSTSPNHSSSCIAFLRFYFRARKAQTTSIPQVQSHHPDCPWDWRACFSIIVRSNSPEQELPGIKDYPCTHGGKGCDCNHCLQTSGDDVQNSHLDETERSYKLLLQRAKMRQCTRKQMCASFSYKEQICPHCI